MGAFNPVALFGVLVVVIWLINSIKVFREYERGVVFRLGRLLPEAKGPGLIFVFWPIDKIVRVPLRTVTLEVAPQDIITSDNVSVKVNAVVYFRVIDSVKGDCGGGKLLVCRLATRPDFSSFGLRRCLIG